MIRILLADAHSLFRESVRLVLTQESDLQIVAEAREGMEAINEAVRAEPDVALLEAGLPNCDGIRATSLIRERVPECQVLVLTAEEDPGVLVESLRAGAKGYLSKESPLIELIEATKRVAKGEISVPSHMLGSLIHQLLHHRSKHDTALQRVSKLTKREREVLAYLSKGEDNGEIARALVISPETARTHIQNILVKLGVHSRLEAAAFVIQNEILEDLVEA